MKQKLFEIIAQGTIPIGYPEDHADLRYQTPIGTSHLQELFNKLESIEDKKRLANAVDEHGNSALHVAARGRNGFVRVLLEHGAAPDVQNKEGQTPLYIAAKAGAWEQMNELIKKGASVEAPAKPRGQHAPQDNDPLRAAALSCEPHCVTLLLKHGAKPSKGLAQEYLNEWNKPMKMSSEAVHPFNTTPQKIRAVYEQIVQAEQKNAKARC